MSEYADIIGFIGLTAFVVGIGLVVTIHYLDSRSLRELREDTDSIRIARKAYEILITMMVNEKAFGVHGEFYVRLVDPEDERNGKIVAVRLPLRDVEIITPKGE